MAIEWLRRFASSGRAVRIGLSCAAFHSSKMPEVRAVNVAWDSTLVSNVGRTPIQFYDFAFNTALQPDLVTQLKRSFDA